MKHLLPVDLDVASLQRLLTRVVTSREQNPVRVLSDSGLSEILHLDAVEERSGAVDGCLPVDTRFAARRVADNRQHVDRVHVQRLRGSLVLIFLLPLSVSLSVRFGVAAEIGSI